MQRSGDFTAPNLADYQLVIFNNWDLETIPPTRKDEIEKYVKQGGGLLVIGGERNMYQEDKEKVEDALDRDAAGEAGAAAIARRHRGGADHR